MCLPHRRRVFQVRHVARGFAQKCSRERQQTPSAVQWDRCGIGAGIEQMQLKRIGCCHSRLRCPGMIPRPASVRTDPLLRGPQGAPQPKAQDHERPPPLPIPPRSSRRGSLPAHRHIEQSSDARLHHDTIARLPAPPVPPEDETDNKSEPQNPESGQSVVGLSGTGKTHIALGLGLAACQKGMRVRFVTAAALVHELIEAVDERRLQRLQKQLAAQDLLIIDELGFVPLSKTGAELLFEIISQRYDRGSIIITSNLPFDEWTETFGTERLTGAILDRLTHHVHILEMNGDSFRLRESRKSKTKN